MQTRKKNAKFNYVVHLKVVFQEQKDPNHSQHTDSTRGKLNVPQVCEQVE